MDQMETIQASVCFLRENPNTQPDGICNPVRNVSWLGRHGCTQNVSDGVANPVALRKTRRSGRECRNPEAMEGGLDSPPCVLDTGNPCRYDGLT